MLEFATAGKYPKLDEAVVAGIECFDDEDEKDLLEVVGDGFLCELEAV